MQKRQARPRQPQVVATKPCIPQSLAAKFSSSASLFHYHYPEQQAPRTIQNFGITIPAMPTEDERAAPLDWAAHEDEIRDLFISKNKTLREVATEMSEKHGFTAR